MTLNPDTILARNSDIICSKVHNKMVMMNIEENTYFGLDMTGAIIWEMLKTPASIAQLIDELVNKFEISKNQCEQDCMEFLLHMIEQKTLLIQKQ
jgi:hypothetical protein